MSAWKALRKEMKRLGLFTPKRAGSYALRVQLVGKVEEHIQVRFMILAHENGVSVGELIELFAHELIEKPSLLKRLLKRRSDKSWTPRAKTGHHLAPGVYGKMGNQNARKHPKLDKETSDYISKNRK